MAMKSFCYFSIGVVGDGTHGSITLNFNSDPFVLSSFGSVPGQAAQLSAAFVLGTTLPSAIDEIQCSDAQAVTATLGLFGNVTFNWPTTVANGVEVTLYGKLRF